MALPLKLVASLVAVALLVAACGGDDEKDDGDRGGGPSGAASFEQPFTGVEAYPVFVSSEIVVGEGRLLIGILNDEDAPIGSEEIEVSVNFYNLERSAEEPVFSSDTDFVPIDEFRGLYEARVSFDEAGKWGAEVTIQGDGIDESVRSAFEVLAEPMTPAIGEKVPATDTPTLDEVDDISDISTDNDPTRRFYETSVAEAVRAGDPFVVVFATPKFCQTAACAPMLDRVEDVAKDFPKVTFIHVEPYDLSKVPQLRATKPTLEWGLPSEPWVFVVDARGRLSAKFEGTLQTDALRADLEKL